MNGRDFETELMHQLEEEQKHIIFPNASELLEKAYRKTDAIGSKASKRRIQPRGILIITVIAAVVCLLGAAVNQYWFSSDINGEAFRTVQDRGYVNMIHQTQKDNGISLTIEAILTDQLTTYVRIRAEGVQKNMREGSEMIIDHLYNYSDSGSSGDWLSYEIQEAVLTDQAGNRWTYKDQITDEFEDVTVSVCSPIMDSEELDENEVILVFYGGPTSDTQMNLEITFFQDETCFSFRDLSVKVPPVFRKQVNGVTFETDYASGTVNEVVYTALQTRFVIDWHVYGSFYPYGTLNRGLYRNGEIEIQDVLPYPGFTSEDKEFRYTDEFILNRTFDPSKELVIERYQDDFTKNMGTFLRIPGDDTT